MKSLLRIPKTAFSGWLALSALALAVSIDFNGFDPTGYRGGGQVTGTASLNVGFDARSGGILNLPTAPSGTYRLDFFMNGVDTDFSFTTDALNQVASVNFDADGTQTVTGFTPGDTTLTLNTFPVNIATNGFTGSYFNNYSAIPYYRTGDYSTVTVPGPRTMDMLHNGGSEDFSWSVSNTGVVSGDGVASTGSGDTLSFRTFQIDVDAAGFPGTWGATAALGAHTGDASVMLMPAQYYVDMRHNGGSRIGAPNSEDWRFTVAADGTVTADGIHATGGPQSLLFNTTRVEFHIAPPGPDSGRVGSMMTVPTGASDFDLWLIPGPYALNFYNSNPDTYVPFQIGWNETTGSAYSLEPSPFMVNSTLVTMDLYIPEPGTLAVAALALLPALRMRRRRRKC